MQDEKNSAPRGKHSSDASDDADLILRHVSRQFPEALARALISSEEPIVVGEWIDTQVSGRQRRLDRALDVAIGAERCLLHVEWQRTMSADVALRMYEYNVLLSLAEVDGAQPGKAPRPVESVVVVLGGREEPWAASGEYRTSRRTARFSGVRFRIEPVYQRTIAELMERESPLWLVFAPLAVDADEQRIVEVVERLRAITAPEALDDLVVAMAVLADTDKRRRGLRGVIKSMLPKELVMENWIYKEGEQSGLERGLGPLAHVFERRLARTLSGEERGVLMRRLETLGPERLGDLVLDESPEALAAFLAAPDPSR